MGYIGIDRAGPISVAEIRSIPGYDVRWSGAYIGGINNGGRGWTPEHVDKLEHAGYYVLPIYVGQNECPGCADLNLTFVQGNADGIDAIACAKRFGYNDGPLCLDIEYGTYEYYPTQCMQYVKAWVETVSNAGYYPVIYGTKNLLEAYQPAHPTGAWLAYWITYVPKIENIPLNNKKYHSYAWQFGSLFHGYDGNVSDGKLWELNEGNEMARITQLAGIVKDKERYFPETGYSIRDGFRGYWENYGGLAIYGFPISHEFVMKCEDGIKRTVQCFERAIFEWHPGENPEFYDVRLSRVVAADININNIRTQHPEGFR